MVCQKDETLLAIEAQGLELEHKIEQTETLRAVIRRLQGALHVCNSFAYTLHVCRIVASGAPLVESAAEPSFCSLA